jgi:hypothetical protein
MNDCTGKHSAKGLRTNAQQTTTNIHVDGVKKLFSGVFLLLLSATEERGRLLATQLGLPSDTYLTRYSTSLGRR